MPEIDIGWWWRIISFQQVAYITGIAGFIDDEFIFRKNNDQR